MNEQSPQGIDEKREKPKLEVWVIEDDNTSRKLIVAVVGMKMPESRCVGFEKAEDALGEFEEKKLEGKPLPAGIFVDGSLLQDSESFQHGPLIVAKIRKMQENSKPPFIVAISGDEELNNAMMQNGANLIVAKPCGMDKLNDALEKIKEESSI